jgi:hypothetical protein
MGHQWQGDAIRILVFIESEANLESMFVQIVVGLWSKVKKKEQQKIGLNCRAFYRSTYLVELESKMFSN